MLTGSAATAALPVPVTREPHVRGRAAPSSEAIGISQREQLFTRSPRPEPVVKKPDERDGSPCAVPARKTTMLPDIGKYAVAVRFLLEQVLVRAPRRQLPTG